MKVYAHDWNGNNRQQCSRNAQSTEDEIEIMRLRQREEIGIEA
jgi:hypothetical protein